MNIEKLRIETHTSNKNNGINKIKSTKTPNLKNIKFFKNLCKAKLEDRHRIKGISFSTNKKDDNNIVLYKIKKNEEATTFELNEANYLRSLKDYNQLKHEIYLKEQKDKKVITYETNLKEKIIKKDINFTFLKETLYQFMRFKKSHYNYNTNLLKNKDEIKRANKIAKSNFINKTMKSVKRRFNTFTHKTDFGISRNEEILNDKEYDNIIEQISKSRLKHLKSFQIINTSPNMESPLLKNLQPKKSQNITFKVNPFISYFQKNIQDNNENKFRENQKNDYKHKTGKQAESKMTNDFNNVCKTDSNANKAFIINKNRQSISGRILSQNRNSLTFQKEFENKRTKSSKYRTHILKNPIRLNNYNKNHSLKTNIFGIKENEKESYCSITSESDQPNINTNGEKNQSYENSLINFERIKKNNLMRERRNPAYWNTNIKRLQTAGNRIHRVINKPLYISKISDFIKEYKRIKSVSKCAKKRMKEEHFTTFENIDKISKIKEDLLMFILIVKFLNCKFPQKKTKKVSKKELFIKKLRNYLNIIDNPYSLASRELKAELKKYESLE